MNQKISRRQLLLALGAGVGGAALVSMRRFMGIQAASRMDAGTLEPRIFIPVVAKPTGTPAPTPTPTPSPTPPAGSVGNRFPGKVVHVRSTDATHWTSGTDYWSYVDQAKVSEMVDRGVMELTGTSTRAHAWRALIPEYQSGQKVAIKVNFNNTFSGQCNNTSAYAIDAIVEPVNALVQGLQTLGASLGDIWVIDAIRALPDRFVSRGVTGIGYYDNGSCRTSSGFASGDSSARIIFSPPSGVPMPPTTKVTDRVVNADWIINIPIMKRHTFGVSLGFKNHFGTINNPSGLHAYLAPDQSQYRSDYNPLVDLYKNRHIGGKTVLTVGDGLFAAKMYTSPPSTWSTFGGDYPKSLFLATDPVSVDCVMRDLLAAEMNDLPAWTNNYLRLAGEAGLGVFEQGNPWGSGYSQIAYRKITV